MIDQGDQKSDQNPHFGEISPLLVRDQNAGKLLLKLDDLRHTFGHLALCPPNSGIHRECMNLNRVEGIRSVDILVPIDQGNHLIFDQSNSGPNSSFLSSLTLL